MKKALFTFLFYLLIPFAVPAQFTTAEIGVTGLTCPQCSRSVEKSIRTLEFVEDVKMNLENAISTVYFKKGADISIQKIASAVKDAGFSVSTIKANYVFTNVVVPENKFIVQDKYSFYFLKSSGQTLNGETTMLFIEPRFMDKKNWEQWKKLMPENKSNTDFTYYVSL